MSDDYQNLPGGPKFTTRLWSAEVQQARNADGNDDPLEAVRPVVYEFSGRNRKRERSDPYS